jgi:hypothetical protein
MKDACQANFSKLRSSHKRRKVAALPIAGSFGRRLLAQAARIDCMKEREIAIIADPLFTQKL